MSILPIVVSAQASSSGGIWEGTTCNQSNIKPFRPCGFCDAVIVARNIINYLFQLAIPLAVGMIVWGAVRIMLAGGSEKNLTAGKETMVSALIGLAVALGAWVIINTLLHVITGSVDFPWSTITCEA